MCLTLAADSFTLSGAVSLCVFRDLGAERLSPSMDRKRILASVVVFLILAILVYLQYRHWRTFDWGTFWSQTHRIKKIHVLHGILLIYLGYVLRAIRWKIFLRPVRPKTSVAELVSPTLVGFTGIALLGRAGEFIRPYLIARRTDLPFSSQLAVWAVERIFDIGAFAVLMALAIFLPSALQSIPHPEYYQRFRDAGFILIGIVAATTVAAIIIGRNGEGAAKWVESRFSHLPSHLGHKLAQKVREFGLGSEYDSRAGVVNRAERGVGGDVVHDRAGLPRSDALLWRRCAGDPGFTAPDIDFRQHAGIDAAIASGRWWIANGHHRDAVERVRRASGDGRELWNSAVAGNIRSRDSEWFVAGTSRKAVTAKAISGEPSGRGFRGWLLNSSNTTTAKSRHSRPCAKYPALSDCEKICILTML